MAGGLTTRGQAGVGLAASGICAVAAWLLPHPVMLAAVGLAPLAVIAALGNPFLLVLGFVVFSFFRLHEVSPVLYPLRIPQLLALGSLAALGWSLWAGRMKAEATRELTAFAAFFAIATMGVMLATNRAEAMANWSGTYVKIAIMTAAIAWLVRRPVEFRLTTLVMVLSGILVGAVALWNKVQGIGLVEGTRVTIGRDIGSMLGDPNDLALVMLFPASFALALVLTPGTGRLAKALGIVGFAVVFAAVIATQSRGGLLGICAVMGVFAWYRVKNKVLLISLGVAALGLLFVLAGIDGRASGGAHEEGIDESAMGRLHAWGAAFRMALHHPLSGVGLDNFLSNYYAYSDFWDGRNHAVHSTWFGVLAETGFLGLGAFLVMVGVTVKSALGSVERLRGGAEPAASVMAQAVLAGLAGFVVSGTFLTMGFTWPLYILLALATATARYARSRPVSRIESQSEAEKS